MDVNVTSVSRLFHHLAPLFALAPAGGKVVVVASRNALAPGKGAAAYSTAKSALTQLSRVAAFEWAEHGVRVNGIPISLDSVCFTHLLEAAGYDTALFGKAHFQNFTTDVPKEIITGLDLDRPPEQLRDSNLNLDKYLVVKDGSEE